MQTTFRNKKKLSKGNFDFQFTGYGHYQVMYTTATGRQYGCTTTDMFIIDATKNEPDPLQKDLRALARMCRRAHVIAQQYK